MLSNYKNTDRSSAKKRGKDKNNLKNSMKGSLIITKNMSNENIKLESEKKILKKIKPSNNNIDDEEEERNENTKYRMNNTKFNKRYIDGKPEKISSKDESDSSLIKKNNKSYTSKDSKEEFYRNSKSNRKNKSIIKSKTKNKENENEFEEEEDINGDMAIDVDENDIKISKKKKNKLKNIHQIDSNDEKKEEKVEKKSDFEIFSAKVLSSSMASFVQQPKII